MGRIHRVSTIAAVILCFMSTQVSAAILDSDPRSASDAQQSAPSSSTAGPDGDASTVAQALAKPVRFTVPDNFFATESTAFAQRGYRGRGRNDGARAAIILGAAATIAGTAVLVYANRPECSNHPMAGGCGYGTKVIGGAVLSAGVAAILIGALTWR